MAQNRTFHKGNIFGTVAAVCLFILLLSVGIWLWLRQTTTDNETNPGIDPTLDHIDHMFDIL